MSLLDYAPGDTIVSPCVPLIKTRNFLRNTSRICDGCFSDLGHASLICDGCGLMTYCSPECRTSDLNTAHSVECGSTIFAKNFNSSLKSHLLRTMSFFVINPAEADRKFELYDGNSRSFNDMMSHFEELNTGESHLKSICGDLANDIANEKLQTGTIVPDTDYFLKLAGIFLTNGFTIYNTDETREIGSGIFIQPAIFNHSCKPTATFCCRGALMRVRAIAVIKKGEEPTVSYIASNMCKEARRKMLKERYHFDCECERCAGDENMDFDKLNRMVDFVSGCTVESMQEVVEPNQDTVNRILNTHNEILEMMLQIYHDYDTRVTSQYSRTVRALLNCTARKPEVLSNAPGMKELIEDTKTHLEITCGQDHPEYLKFVNIVIKNNFNQN